MQAQINKNNQSVVDDYQPPMLEDSDMLDQNGMPIGQGTKPSFLADTPANQVITMAQLEDQIELDATANRMRENNFFTPTLIAKCV